MRKQVYVYGFDKLNRVVDYGYLEEPNISIGDIINIRDFINGDVVYAVDNSAALRTEFWSSVRTRDFTKHLEFKDYVERNGIRIR